VLYSRREYLEAIHKRYHAASSRLNVFKNSYQHVLRWGQQTKRREKSQKIKESAPSAGRGFFYFSFTVYYKTMSDSPECPALFLPLNGIVSASSPLVLPDLKVARHFLFSDVTPTVSALNAIILNDPFHCAMQPCAPTCLFSVQLPCWRSSRCGSAAGQVRQSRS